MENPSRFCPDVPLHDLLTCAAKLVTLVADNAPGADPFCKLFAAQDSIEAFAASAATPLEADLAEAMRFMSAEMLRRQWWNTGHPHRELVNICASLFRFAPYRFAKPHRSRS